VSDRPPLLSLPDLAAFLRARADALETEAARWQHPTWRVDLNETSHRIAELRAAATAWEAKTLEEGPIATNGHAPMSWN
jgi:hypothetical protein